MMPWWRRAARRSQLRRGPHGVHKLRLGARHRRHLDETGRELVDPGPLRRMRRVAGRRRLRRRGAALRPGNACDCACPRSPRARGDGQRRRGVRDRARSRPRRRRRLRLLTMAGTTTQQATHTLPPEQAERIDGYVERAASRPMRSGPSTTRPASTGSSTRSSSQDWRTRSNSLAWRWRTPASACSRTRWSKNYIATEFLADSGLLADRS